MPSQLRMPSASWPVTGPEDVVCPKVEIATAKSAKKRMLYYGCGMRRWSLTWETALVMDAGRGAGYKCGLRLSDQDFEDEEGGCADTCPGQQNRLPWSRDAAGYAKFRYGDWVGIDGF